MKRVLALAVVAAALGFWGGVRAYHSASLDMQIQAGLAIVIGGNFVLCLWLWRRARPGSGDAMVMVAPFMTLLSASMLVGILPRLLWPDAAAIRIAGSIASIIGTTTVLIVQIRRWRSLRAAKP